MGVLALLAGGPPPACPACQKPLRKGKQSSGAVTGTILGLILLAGGVAVFIFIPCFGWVLGPLLALLAWFCIGGKRVKVWRCRSCKTFLPRG